MKTVKYRCKKCGYAEEYTKKEKIFNALSKVFLSLLLVFGLFLMVYVIIVGPTIAIGSITTSVMMKYATTSDQSTHDGLRHMGIEWTQHCEPYDNRCFALGVYHNLKHIPYVQASLISPIQPPEETFVYGGDCKNSAILYTSTLNALGVKALVICSSKEHHCVSAVPDEENGVFYVVDLTMPGIFELPISADTWDYDEIGKVII